MEHVEIKTTLTAADWDAYQAHWAQRLLHGQGFQRFAGLLLGVLVVLAAAAIGDYLDRPLSIASLLVGIVLATIGSVYNAARAQRVTRPDSDGFVLGPSSIVFSANGIDFTKPSSVTRYSWALVKDLAWTDQHLFVWVDRVAAFIVPLRDLPEGLSPQQLSEAIRVFRGAPMQSMSEPELVLPQPPPRDESRTHDQEVTTEPAPFKRFMRAYAALLLGRTPAANDLTISLRLILLLPGVGFGIWLLFDRWRAGPDAEFAPYAVLTWSWYAVIVLTVVWAASRLAQPRVPYDRLLAIAAAFAPIFLALTFLQDEWVRQDWAVVTTIAITLYGAIYLSGALRSLTGRRQPRAAWSLAALLIVAVWVSYSMYFSGRFWYASELDEESSGYLADMTRSEALLYAQPKRIDAAVQALQRPEALPAAAFFLGFAGDGSQRVFAGEIALARKVVASRFGSAQRSVLLVNDRRDLDTLPFASPTALRYALKGIAARMRLESDVLFLSLSSHGSREGELSVNNGMLGLNDLSAHELADALRESGIKRKVVVVSACYAGKFIEPLRDDNTIVIAAAAADRTSFGCSDDRDLTYFGEAFYRDALPATSDLRSAFQKTAAEITARERTEGKTASNPQAHFGLGLVDYLQSAFPGT